jgi:hypothetical protein
VRGDAKHAVAIAGREHWTKLIAALDGPITLLLADATHPGRLVAQAGWCSNGGRGDWGGWAYASDDGGATWRRIDPAPAPDGPDGAPYLDVDIAGGDAHHLVLEYAGHTVESLDGKTWKPTSRVIAPHQGGPVTVRGDTYHPTAGGIVRVRPGQPPVHLQLPR